MTNLTSASSFLFLYSPPPHIPREFLWLFSKILSSSVKEITQTFRISSLNWTFRGTFQGIFTLRHALYRGTNTFIHMDRKKSVVSICNGLSRRHRMVTEHLHILCFSAVLLSHFLSQPFQTHINSPLCVIVDETMCPMFCSVLFLDKSYIDSSNLTNI